MHQERPIPDGTTPIYAFRLWSIRGGLLRSVYFNSYTWPPGEPANAADGPSCWKLHSVFHRERKDCGCGLYATKTPLRAWWLEVPMFDGPMAFGIVALWGEVHEHKCGYRAEFGEPVAVFVSYEDYNQGKAIEFNYGVPVYPISILGGALVCAISKSIRQRIISSALKFRAQQGTRKERMLNKAIEILDRL